MYRLQILRKRIECHGVYRPLLRNGSINLNVNLEGLEKS